MSSLTRSVFVAARPLTGRSLVALGVPTAVLCGAIIAKGMSTPAAAAVSVAPPIAVESAPAAMAVVQDSAPERGAAISRDISLVFATPDGLYMTLANLGEGELPRHGRAHHYPAMEGNYVETAVARVAPADVPTAYAGWIGRDVVVDGACTATVTHIAVASRLYGDVGYASNDSAWNGTNVMQYGTPMLVAAIEGCASGTIAHAATQANPLEMTEITDGALAAAAKRALIESRAGKAAQKAWSEQIGEWGGTPGSTWWQSTETEWKTKVMRHPTTGATFVSIHAQQPFACGGPEVNVWGMFRVEAEGRLASLDAALGDIYSIERFFDVDHDGTPEVMGSVLLGGSQVNDIHGGALTKLEERFYGCPC